MDWQLLLISQTLNGIQLGMLLFLVAAGLTLVFGIMDLVNLAHGAFYMVGAYLTATLAQLSGQFLAALLISIPLMIAFGMLMERLIIHRLYRLSHLDHVLATFGLVLCIDTAVHYFAGSEGKAIELPAYLDGHWLVLGVNFPVYRLFIIAVGLLVAALLFVLVNKTRLGMRIRAGASDRDMINALGVNINHLYRVVFAIGAALAGLAGAMITPIAGANTSMGNEIIIIALVVVIIGGIGSIKGAFWGAMLVGMIDTLGRAFIDDLLKLVISTTAAETAGPALASMMVYLLMALVLAIKPHGLFPANHQS